MDAFDADVLIYAVSPTHPLAGPILTLFPEAAGLDDVPRVGSVLLVSELLTKPLREGLERESSFLSALLTRMELLPVDRATVDDAVSLGVTYGLDTVDAVHLATAVRAGADRFITNNQRDFPRSIREIDVVYPEDLPDPAG
jgi:predicted nucleic acid-binding protein